MRHITCAAVVFACLLAPALFAQDGLAIDVKPVVEGEATPGGELTLKLNFSVPDGYHAYHKDNPGWNGPIRVTFHELSGLVLKDETWPEPHKKVDEFSEEWELSGSFDVEYVFEVPEDASGTLTVRGSHNSQYCDAEGCYPTEGDFSAEISVSGGQPEEELPKAEVTAGFEGTATAGGEATLKLRFEFTEGYHTYHRDTPGYGVGPKIDFNELSGLKVAKTHWPDPVTHEYDADWVEWEYKNELTVTYTLSVPEGADGELPVELDWDVQVCNDEGCWIRKGTATATLTVTDEPGVNPDEEANDATNDHGFYVDFNYALKKAKTENKLLLADFNGRH